MMRKGDFLLYDMQEQTSILTNKKTR